MPKDIMSDTQLTVEQLLHYLQELVKKDPKMKDALVCHAEFGAITPSFSVMKTKQTDKYDENETQDIIIISGS